MHPDGQCVSGEGDEGAGGRRGRPDVAPGEDEAGAQLGADDRDQREVLPARVREDATEADEPLLVANWAQVGADRKIKRIRVTFDPQPIVSC